MKILKKNLLDNVVKQVGFVDYGIIRYADYQLATGFKHVKFDFVKSIISFALQYDYHDPKLEAGQFKFAKFAYGTDYHQVVSQKIDQVRKEIELLIGPFEFSIHVDTTLLNEKEIASMAGLGFIGRNSLVISKKVGSFFVLGELCVDFIFDEYTTSIQQGCNHCRRCVDACPTHAIGLSAANFDQLKCLSHLTQKKLLFDESAFLSIEDTIYGCDICQDVCPYNIKKHPYEPQLALDDSAITTLDEFLHMTKTAYDERYANKTHNYVRYEVILRNILIASTNKKTLNKDILLELLQKYQQLPWMIQVINQAIGRIDLNG
jgi:epoxyqueuosine reductase